MEPLQQTSNKEEGEPPAELKLGDIIGNGAFGIIFSAHSRNFGEIAVKMIFHPPTPDSEKILREALVMNLQPHVNIVSVKHFLQKSIRENEIQELFGKKPMNSRQSYIKTSAIEGANGPRGMQMTQICMQLCGKTVAEWIASKPNKDDLSTKLLQVGICVGTRDGLKFLHDKGIVHRDLKPLNIMFSLDEQEFKLPVKIGDFGFARFLHAEGPLTSKVGTLDYMAPETITKNYDQQSDLYSLGCVIWEVVSLLSASERQARSHQVASAAEGSNIVGGHTYLQSIEEDILNLVAPEQSTRAKSINDLKFVPSVTHVFVSSTYELLLTLQLAPDGVVIQLANGTYKGNFQIKQNRLRLVGSGEGTIITGDSTILLILGTGCVLLNFSIVGDGNGIGIFIASNNCCLAHLNVGSHYTGIQVYGNNSYLTCLDIRNVQGGIMLMGSEHLVKNCYIDEAKRGVTALGRKGGKRTVISGLGYRCCTVAFELRGEHCLIDKVYALNSDNVSPESTLTLVEIFARNSMLCNIDITNGSHIYFRPGSADSILLGTACGQLTLDGNSHFCSNVNVHGTIELLGSNMEIRNCKFQSITASGTSNFGSVTVGADRNRSTHQLYSHKHLEHLQYLLDISKGNHPSTMDQRLQEVAQEYKGSVQNSVERGLSNYTSSLQEAAKEYGPSNYPDGTVQREVQLRSINVCGGPYALGMIDSIAVKLSSGAMLCCLQGLPLVGTKVVRAARPNVPILLSIYEGNHLQWSLSTSEREAEYDGANVYKLGEVLVLGIPRTQNPAEATIIMQVDTSGIVTVSAAYEGGEAGQDLDVMEIVSSTGLEMFRPLC